MSKNKRNDNLWLNYLETFKKYLEEYHQFPVNNTVYCGINLGSWLRNQISAKNRGDLPNDRLEMLNAVNPFWAGTREEKAAENRRLLFHNYEHNVKPNFIASQVPIDRVCKDENELYICLLNGITTCKELLLCGKEDLALHSSIKTECYAELFPFIDMNYFRLLRIVKGYNFNTSYEENKIFINSLAVRSAEEMRQIFDEEMNNKLSDRNQKIIRFRLGLDNGICRTIHETAKEFGITNERVRLIEAKAYRLFRHPSSSIKLFMILTNTILDEICPAGELRSGLYRLGIDTEEKVLKLIETLKGSEQFQQLHAIETALVKFKARENAKAKELDAEPVQKKIHELQIGEIGLSTRSYNSLLRVGVVTVEQLEKKLENFEEIKRIRNFGMVCLQEVCQILNGLYNEEKYIVEDIVK